MKFSLFALSILVSSSAFADSFIYLDLKSHHFKPKPYYIENHDLFGIERDGWLLVRYTNSEGRHSIMAGRRAVWGNVGLFSYGAKYGMVSGYNTKILGDFAPFALLNGVFDFRRLALDVNFVPAFAVVSFGLRIDL